MPVIAVINRKGGSGKSTLATHLAAYCATHGMPVMLGDVDRQQSTRGWLRQREKQPQPEQNAPIVSWTVDPKNVRRPPAGIRRVILDTPGGMRGFDLARVVMFADAILMPVCNSAFDRDSAAACYAELLTLPRVANGRCQVGAVGMRLDGRTKAAEVLQAWADEHQIPFVGVLRETQAYVRCIEQGLTLFDLPAAQVQADMAQWQPILQWIDPVLNPADIDMPVTRPAPLPARTEPARPANAPQRTQIDALAEFSQTKRAPVASRAPRRNEKTSMAKLLGWLPLPRFLQRRPRATPEVFAGSAL